MELKFGHDLTLYSGWLKFLGAIYGTTDGHRLVIPLGGYLLIYGTIV